MNADEWKEIKGVFVEASELPETERSAFLDKCGADLRFEVERLLKADSEAEDFILEPAMVEIGLVEEDTPDFYVGKQIDSYRIIREVGRGGMGTVYLADRADEAFDRQVAVKLIKRGMDTNAVLKRFVMERQILANLEHPNIASLLDGGSTTDGLPYLVMEFVEGEPITKYCDSHHLDINERLELFQKVCSAVSYAHQNLVVHRDLKPSNILVTEDGTPKLLDFGIAKLLHPEWSLDTNEATATMFRVMTPEYASPEQIRGLPITTASDVYSLGVVLYELLSGERPYKIESRMPEEVARIVLTEEPIKPSSIAERGVRNAELRTIENAEKNTDNDKIGIPHSAFRTPHSRSSAFRNLKGDLDNIILKALRKEPERRYASVQEFSEDIRRHLAGLPVTATADTSFYRLGKFVKRHRAGVFASLFMLLSLLTGISVATWQAVEAREERAKAEQRFNDVRKLTNSFLFEFHDAVKDLPGSTKAREMTVKKALEYLDILAQEQSNDASLQFELASAYLRVADIQGSPGESNLGDTAGAVVSYRKAIEILKKLIQTAPENLKFKRELASAYKSIVYIFGTTGDSDLFQLNNQEALTLYQELVESDGSDFSSKLALAECYKTRGDFIASKGNLELALQDYRTYLEISEAVLVSQPESKSAKIGIMAASDAIGATLGNPNYTNLGDTDGALQAYKRQLQVCNEMLVSDGNSQYLDATKAFTLKVIGEVQTARGEWKKAVESYLQSLEIQEEIVKSDPKDAFAAGRLGYLLSNLGEAMANTNRLAESMTYHSRAIEILEKLAEADKENSALVLSLHRAYQKNGDALVNSGRATEALSFYHKALKSNEEIAAQDLSNMDMRLQLANDYLKIAKANVILATRPASSSDEKIKLWREAKKRFEQSRDVYFDMQSHNLKTKPISDSLNNLAKEIVRCDDALKRLAGN